ncbi:hypothetical protein GCM10009826_40190 [Humibacillus xanthopallidus]
MARRDHPPEGWEIDQVSPNRESPCAQVLLRVRPAFGKELVRDVDRHFGLLRLSAVPIVSLIT